LCQLLLLLIAPYSNCYTHSLNAPLSNHAHIRHFLLRRPNSTFHRPITHTITMKNAITIAAASAALATAAATPAKLQARASGTSSGSVPQVSVKGNGTR
jgi:ABC-type spermidine/putrescine transport system permease subunit II